MDFDDLITVLAPRDRMGRTYGEHAHYLCEGALMVAYAMHLLRTGQTKEVRIHPNGEHDTHFDFVGWLARHGFSIMWRTRKTSYGGTYADRDGRTIIIFPGLGEVVAEVGDQTISAECRGGIINARHSTSTPDLLRGLCETIGLLMATPSPGRQVAVVPYTEATLRLATRLAARCGIAGIELALVRSRGEVIDVKPS